MHYVKYVLVDKGHRLVAGSQVVTESAGAREREWIELIRQDRKRRGVTGDYVVTMRRSPQAQDVGLCG